MESEAEVSRPVEHRRIHQGEGAGDYISEVLENCVWRQAISVDGRWHWTTKDGQPGELVNGRAFKFRQKGSYMLLAPMESDLGKNGMVRHDQIDKENDARFHAFVTKVTDIIWKCVAEGGKDENADAGPCQLTPERLRRIVKRIITTVKLYGGHSGGESELEQNSVQLSQEAVRAAIVLNLDEYLADIVVDGVLIKDIHGRLDLDFDNCGPELIEESQPIDQGILSWLRRDQEEEQRAFVMKRANVMASLGPGDTNGSDDGYESDSSVISGDHCRESPYYPSCGASCWLKSLNPSGVEALLNDTSEPLEDVSSSYDTYQYLQPGYTRVLILEPGELDDEVLCTLQHINILDQDISHDFDALSYCWGNPTPTHLIVCNGQPLGIASNLFSALRHLRLRGSTRTLWVDAICINQTDVEERNKQIQNIYDIYNRATRVVVWLGVDGQHSELAVQAARHLSSRPNRHSVIRHDHDVECLQNLDKVLGSLEAMLRQQWFRRSWIRQEIAAARRVVVQCGHGRITWGELKRAVNCRWRLREKLLNNGKALSYIPLHQDDDGGEFNTLKYLNRKKLTGQPLAPVVGDLRSLWYYHAGGLLEYLMTGRAFEATDPRDKVYSVLGMTGTPIDAAQSAAEMIETLSIDGAVDRAVGIVSGNIEKEGHSPSSSQAIRIDYSATVSEVYQQVAKFLINATYTLDILIIISTHRSLTGCSDDLPSWCPDWRVPTSEIALGANYEYFHYKFGAAGFTKCLSQDENDIGRLKVQGFWLDLVTERLDIGVTSIPHPPEEPTGSLEVPFNPETHLKCLCHTEKRTGFFPGETRIGDEVWILYGCRMPMVLAAVNKGEYLVVGPCYLPTMMWGKALKEFLESGNEIDTIVLV